MNFDQEKLIKKFGPDLKLDIGCGRNKIRGFIGVDIDKNSGADIICSALKLPFKNSAIREINCSHLIEHFSPQEARKFLDEIHRVLKDGGRAHLKIDRDWSEGRLLRKDPDHKKRYSAEEIRLMLPKFTVSKAENKIYRFGRHLRNKIFVELKKNCLDIGIITASLSESDGWGRYSLGVVEELRKNNEVKVLFPGIGLPSPLGHPLKLLFSFLKIEKSFKNCDVIHCLSEPYAPASALASVFLKKPFFITAHGTYALKPFDKMGIDYFLMKFAFKKADKIICVSDFTKGAILKRLKFRGLAEKLEVVPNGINYAAFAGKRQFKKASGRKKMILSVGAIKLRKGYDISIKAISRLKNEKLTYVIAGPINDEIFCRELEEMIKLNGLSDKVKLLGEVSEKDLIKLYRQCDIFLLTPKNIGSEVEGFGLVYLEANAFSKPVIGTLGCGAESAIINGYNGILVPQKDPEATARAIKSLLKNSRLAKKMGENGKKRAKELSWQNVVKKITELYGRYLC